MVSCKRCITPNSLDSKFCRSCGVALAEEDLELAVAEHESLVGEGYHALNEGRTDEAALIAASAVESNPSSLSALSLRGMCHEREGELAEALACYEKVVDLHPDSALDKIKVTQLRNLLAGRAAHVEPPNRKRALLGALAAVVFVVAVSSIAAMLTQGGDGTRVASNEPKASDPVGFTGAPGAVNSAPTATTESPTAPAVNPPAVNPNPNPTPSIQFPALGNPAAGQPGLPNPNGFEPVVPEGPIGPQTRPLPENPRPGVRPPDADDPVGPPINPDPRPTAPREDTGMIDIKVSSGGPRVPTGGSATNDANGLEALQRTARQQYQLGKYADAARSYEQMLRFGGDSGSTNQRLGQCYEKLGKSTEAGTAYTRAIGALELSLKSGKGDTGRTQAALDACRQALKIVKGG